MNGIEMDFESMVNIIAICVFDSNFQTKKCIEYKV